MGRAYDPMAVVDNTFRVYGTKNLRVVDASVFPRIPRFFIVTSVYMIAEKASDVILAEPNRCLLHEYLRRERQRNTFSFQGGVTMPGTSLRPLEVVVVLVVLCIAGWFAWVVPHDIKVLKADIKSLRGLLSALPTTMQCPLPGEHTTRICHYTLQIQGPLENQKGWFLATIPQEVVQTAKTDCDNVKASNPDMMNHMCVDPTMYNYTEYAVYVEGTVPDKGPHEFVNDPVTNHLIFKK